MVGAPPDDSPEPPRGAVIARSPQGDAAIQGNVERPTIPGSPRFARDDDGSPRSPNLVPALDHRPENPPQGSEKVQSAPGIADVAARWSRLWDATLRVVPQHEARQSPPAAPAGDDRPGIRPQTPEKIESAPGIGRPAEAAPAPGESSFDGPMILTPTGWKPATMRILQNGVAA